jgi:hypothetical protein
VQVDRSDLDLPGGQLPLLQALTATGTPVVVLLLRGKFCPELIHMLARMHTRVPVRSVTRVSQVQVN